MDLLPPLKSNGVMAVVGPSFSGKTELLKRMVANADALFEQPPTMILICHHPGCGDQFRSLRHDPRVQLSEGLPKDGFQSLRDCPGTKLCIFDDLVLDRELMHNLTCVYAHHWHTFFVFTFHQLFAENNRVVRLNARYLTLMSSPADRSSVAKWAAQYRPGATRYFLDCYADATSRPYGYMVVDLTHEADERRRLRTNVLGEPGLPAYAYEPI